MQVETIESPSLIYDLEEADRWRRMKESRAAISI